MVSLIVSYGFIVKHIGSVITAVCGGLVFLMTRWLVLVTELVLEANLNRGTVFRQLQIS